MDTKYTYFLSKLSYINIRKQKIIQTKARMGIKSHYSVLLLFYFRIADGCGGGGGDGGGVAGSAIGYPLEIQHHHHYTVINIEFNNIQLYNCSHSCLIAMFSKLFVFGFQLWWP